MRVLSIITFCLCLGAEAAITSPVAALGKVGDAFTYQITADNSPTEFRARVGTKDIAVAIPGLTVDPATGLISGIPTIGGNFSVRLNARGKSSSASLTVSFSIAKRIGTITSAAVIESSLKTVFSFPITASFQPTKYTAIKLPMGLSLDTETGVIFGEFKRGGVFTSVISVTGPGDEADQALVFVISGATTSPGSVSLAPVGVQNEPYFGGLSASGATPITFTVSALPPGLTLEGSVIRGIPTEVGITPVEITATNAVGTRTSTVNFEIGLQDGKPLILNDLEQEGQVAERFYLRLLSLERKTTTFEVVGDLPRGLRIESNVISGVPFDVGAFPLTITASNLKGSDTRTITLTIAPIKASTLSGRMQLKDKLQDKVGKFGNGVVHGKKFNLKAEFDTTGVDLSQLTSASVLSVAIGEFYFERSLEEGRLLKNSVAFVDAISDGRLALSFKWGPKGMKAMLGGTSLEDSFIPPRTLRWTDEPNPGINETIPVKIEFRNAQSNLTCAFFMPLTGSSVRKVLTKVVDGQTQTVPLSKVSLQGEGSVIKSQ